MQSAPAVALKPLDFFAAYNAAVTHTDFQWAGQPYKLPLHLMGSGPQLILMHGSLGTPESILQSAC